MATQSINSLIEQGYLIKDADDKWSGEVWHLQYHLRTSFDDAFENLRTKEAECNNARIDKETAVKKEHTTTFRRLMQ